jgi:hypothetical protein
MFFTKLAAAAAAGAVIALPTLPTITPMAHTTQESSVATTQTAGLVRSDVGDPPGNKNRDDGHGNTGGGPGGSVGGYKGCSSDGSGSC